jgi:MFS family permease
MQKPEWLNGNVISLSVTSFLSDFGHEAVTVILPAFLATIGLGAAALGLIEGLSDAASSFTKLGSGYYADKTGNKKQISILGYFLTGIFPIIIATAVGFWQVLLGRILGWFGRGIRGPPRDAILTESVNGNHLGKAFGLHRAGDTLGSIAGPVLALLILPFVNYREIMWYSVIPGTLAMIVFAIFVKDKFAKRGDERQQLDEKQRQRFSFFSGIKNMPKSFKGFLVGVGIFGISDFSHTLLILYATTTLTPQVGLVQASALAASFYIIRNVVYAAASFPIGYLGDVLGKKRILVIGYLLATLMFVGFIFLQPSVWTFVALFSVAGLYIATEDALEGAIAGSILKDESRNTGFGLLGTVNGIGDLVSSAVVGILWTVLAPSYGFLFAAIVSVVGAVVLAIMKVK